MLHLCFSCFAVQDWNLSSVYINLQVGLRNNLPITAPVDNAGVFTDEAGQFQGEPLHILLL